MVQLKPCPPSMIEKMKEAHQKNPIQHFVLWDTTYALNEEGSCQVMDYHKFQNLRRCDGYDPDRYEILASTRHLLPYTDDNLKELYINLGGEG